MFYRQAEAVQPNDAAILQKIAKQLSDSVSDAPTIAERQKLASEALHYTQRALLLTPHDPACVLSLAICYGKLSTYADAREKIAYARLVKRHAEEALALNPEYALAHHVLGRWHYEIAQVGGPSRAVAKILYGGVPKGSCAEAVTHLRTAVRLSPDTAAHRIELGFALLSCGERKEALAAFRRGLELPSREKYDEVEKQRARPLYDKLTHDLSATE